MLEHHKQEMTPSALSYQLRDTIEEQPRLSWFLL